MKVYDGFTFHDIDGKDAFVTKKFCILKTKHEFHIYPAYFLDDENCNMEATVGMISGVEDVWMKVKTKENPLWAECKQTRRPAIMFHKGSEILFIDEYMLHIPCKENIQDFTMITWDHHRHITFKTKSFLYSIKDNVCWKWTHEKVKAMNEEYDSDWMIPGISSFSFPNKAIVLEEPGDMTITLTYVQPVDM
jgi:hypothetical protein